MAIFSQNDVRIKIDDADLFCQSADIDYNANIQPKYDVLNDKSAFSYAASTAPRGTFNIQYYLTGADPIVDKMVNERNPVSINYNNLHINSGYLNSYMLNASSFGEISIHASFSFYCRITGTYTASSQLLSDTPPLNTSDMTIDDGNVVLAEKVKSIDYRYQTSIDPKYVVEENFDSAGVNITGVVGGPKRVETSFSIFDYDLSLPVTGDNESFKFNFKNKNGTSLQEYSINGQLDSKGISSSSNNLVISKYSVSQANLGGISGTPLIHGFPTTAADVGEPVAVYCKNIENLEKFYIGEYPCEISGGKDNVVLEGTIYQFTGIVSPDMLSGYKGLPRVVTTAGEAVGSPSTVFSCSSGLANF